MIAGVSATPSPLTIVLGVFAVASALGAAFAVFKANAATTLIDLLKENVHQLEISRDVAERKAVEAAAETRACNVRAEQQEQRIKTLERLVTGVDAIRELSETIDLNHKEVMRVLKPPHRSASSS